MPRRDYCSPCKAKSGQLFVILKCLLKALSLASPAQVNWVRTRPEANPTEDGPKELAGIRIVLMIVQETGDPRLQ